MPAKSERLALAALCLAALCVAGLAQDVPPANETTAPSGDAPDLDAAAGIRPSDEQIELLTRRFEVNLPDGGKFNTSRGEMAFNAGFDEGYPAGYGIGYTDGKDGKEPMIEPAPAPPGPQAAPPQEVPAPPAEGGRRLLQDDADADAPAETDADAPAETDTDAEANPFGIPELTDEEDAILSAPVEITLPNGTVVQSDWLEIEWNNGRTAGFAAGYIAGYDDGKAGNPRAVPLEASGPPSAAEGEGGD